MIHQLFNQLTLAMNASFIIALLASYSWGIFSILLSPCHLTSIPLIIGYISGQRVSGVKRSFFLSTVFAVGILISVALIGLITASMGRLVGDVGGGGNYLVAAIFFIMGLYLMDLIPLQWNELQLRTGTSGVAGALLLGLIFGVGLGPCTFAYMAPVLGVVFTMAVAAWLKTLFLILAFGFGQCTVIISAGTLTQVVQKYLKWTNSSKKMIVIRRFSGFLVVLGGVYFIAITF